MSPLPSSRVQPRARRAIAPLKNGGSPQKASAPRPASKPWRRVPFMHVVHITSGRPPFNRPWTWRKVTNAKNRPRLQLVSPNGRLWDFRLNNGAWLRPAPAQKGAA